MKDQGYTLTVEDSALNYIASEAYTPQYGARPVKRYIQNHVETQVARIVMKGDLSMGDEVVVSADMDVGLKFDVVHKAETVEEPLTIKRTLAPVFAGGSARFFVCSLSPAAFGLKAWAKGVYGLRLTLCLSINMRLKGGFSA